MDLVFGIVRLGLEDQGEFLRGYIPLLQLLVFEPFLEILFPVFSVGQSRAGQQQDQRQKDGQETAARGSNVSIDVHGDDPLYYLISGSAGAIACLPRKNYSSSS